MTKVQDKQWEETIQLAIKNEGGSALTCYYWYLLIAASLNSCLPLYPPHGQSSSSRIEPLENGQWMHWSGIFYDPLFLERSFNFPYGIQIKTHSLGQWLIYYFFSTEFGIFPPKAKLLEEKPGETLSKGYLGKLIIIAGD